MERGRGGHEVKCVSCAGLSIPEQTNTGRRHTGNRMELVNGIEDRVLEKSGTGFREKKEPEPELWCR